MKTLFTYLLLTAAVATASAQPTGTWQSKGSGISTPNRSMQGLSVVDSNAVWGVTYHLAGAATREFIRTIDGGNTWTSGIIDVTDGDSFTNLSIFAIDENIAWVNMTNAGMQNRGRIYKTTNGGQTWVQQMGSFNNAGNAFGAFHFFDENNGVAFGSPGTGNNTVDSLRIWITTNGGNTWDRIPKSQLPSVLAGEGTWTSYGNGSYAAIGDTIWFGTRRGRVWHSTDKGISWKVFPINTQIANEAFSIAFKDTKNGIAVSYRKAFYTEDGGNSWQSLLSLPPSIVYYQIQHIPGTDGVYFLSYEGSTQFYTDIRFAYTLDNGNTWALTTDPGIECFQFASPTHAWGGGQVINATQGGMYRWKGNFTITTATNEPLGITKQIQLSPNPFKSQTLLEFELKDNTLPVDITITDMLGRTLKSFRVEQPNVNINQLQMNIDAPAGLLFLTLRQGTGVKTIKMRKQ